MSGQRHMFGDPKPEAPTTTSTPTTTVNEELEMLPFAVELSWESATSDERNSICYGYRIDPDAITQSGADGFMAGYVDEPSIPGVITHADVKRVDNDHLSKECA